MPRTSTTPRSGTSRDVAAYLNSQRHEILSKAVASMSRARLAHYDSAGREVTALRLRELFDVVVDACEGRRLDHALAHADAMVKARISTGVELGEVQTAINVLEECLWQSIAEHVDPAGQVLALGLVSTVLGAIKDRIAQSYLSHAAGHTVTPLRVDLLFGGSEGNPSMARR